MQPLQSGDPRLCSGTPLVSTLAAPAAHCCLLPLVQAHIFRCRPCMPDCAAWQDLAPSVPKSHVRCPLCKVAHLL